MLQVNHFFSYGLSTTSNSEMTSPLLQLSFQMWTNQMQETLNSKKHGDTAFRAKDFGTAIDCYTQVSFLIPNLFNYNIVSRPVNVDRLLRVGIK